VEIAVATVAKWPIAVLDPEPKYTTDGYQVVQSNDGAIGILRGEKERTFTAGVAPEMVPKAGLYEGGLLRALIGAAIPFLYTVFIISPLCCSLLLPASIQPGLYSPLTLY
jgi:hypothetical protein